MTAGHSITERYVERIEAQVDELARIIVASTDAQWRHRPGEQEWDAAEVCGHVAEMMPFWAEAARHVAFNPGASFGRHEHDPRRLGGPSQGASLSRHDAVEQLRHAAATTCQALRELPDTAWQTEGVSITRGPMTVEQIIETLLAAHLEGHVRQVEEAVGGL